MILQLERESGHERASVSRSGDDHVPGFFLLHVHFSDGVAFILSGMESGIVIQLQILAGREVHDRGFVGEKAGRRRREVVVGDCVLSSLDLLLYVPVDDHFRVGQATDFGVVADRRIGAGGQIARLISQHQRVLVLSCMVKVVEDAELFHEP